MADLYGRLTYLNPALCRMLGEERRKHRTASPHPFTIREKPLARERQQIEPSPNSKDTSGN